MAMPEHTAMSERTTRSCFLFLRSWASLLTPSHWRKPQPLGGEEGGVRTHLCTARGWRSSVRGHRGRSCSHPPRASNSRQSSSSCPRAGAGTHSPSASLCAAHRRGACQCLPPTMRARCPAGLKDRGPRELRQAGSTWYAKCDLYVFI